MATIPATIGDLIQVRVVGFQRQQRVENVLHFAAAQNSSDVEIDLILILIQCFVTHILPALSPEFTYDTVQWKRVSPTLSPEFITPFPAATTGTGSAADLPTFVSVVASIRTNAGGRSHRGRMFLPGPPESQTIGNSVDTAGTAWAAYLAFVACIVSKFIVGDPPGPHSWNIGVYSRKIGGSSFPYGAAGFTPAVQISPVAALATMRSRKVGHGS